jgi:coenzyme F420-reducing hydrogenase delta subunit
MRLQYPTNIRVIMVPCTGRVDIIHLLNAIEDGADGVYVAGCLEGDCHYISGNLKARKRVERVKHILEELGLEPERVEMYNLSASQGPRFAEIAREMSEKISKLGPSPIKAVKKAA